MSESVPEKKCTGPCGRTLPVTPQFFYRNGKYFQSRCKECYCAYVKEKDQDIDPEKRARNLARRKEYLRNHPEIREKRNAKERARRKQSAALAKQRAYRSRPEVIARRRTYHKNSAPERVRAYKRAYNSKPEAKLRAHAHRVNRRSRLQSTPGKCAPGQVQNLLKRQKYKCYYCGNKFEKKDGKHIFHIDHTFPLSRVAGLDIPANDISYLVLACPPCNLKKKDKFPWEFPEGGRLL